MYVLPLFWLGQRIRVRLAGQKRGGRGEDGTVIETLILSVFMLMVIFGTIQISLWYHARNLAIATAREAVREAQIGGNGYGSAAQFAGQTRATELIHGMKVTITRTATTVSVTVDGTVTSAIPFLSNLPVHQVATGAIEQVTTPDGQPVP